MAAVPSAVQSALAPTWSPRQNAAQVVGHQGRDLSEMGVPEHLPQYAPDGGQSMPTDVYPNPFTEHLDFIGHEYSGTPIDQTRTAPYDIDSRLAYSADGPSIPYTTFPYATEAHSQDAGGPRAWRKNNRADIGDPSLNDWQAVNSDYTSDRTAPIGYNAEMPGQFVGHNLQWTDNRNLGYTYVGYDERPLYNTLAAVAPDLDEARGLYQPDGSYAGQATIYNDGGIPPAYQSPPDPPTGGTPDNEANAMGFGF